MIPPETVEVDALEWWCICADATISVVVAVYYLACFTWKYLNDPDY